MLGLHTVPVVICATLVVGMGPRVVAHMQPWARPTDDVQPLMALGRTLAMLVETNSRMNGKSGPGKGGATHGVSQLNPAVASANTWPGLVTW